jgi:hypothetical protein
VKNGVALMNREMHRKLDNLISSVFHNNSVSIRSVELDTFHQILIALCVGHVRLHKIIFWKTDHATIASLASFFCRLQLQEFRSDMKFSGLGLTFYHAVFITLSQ